MLSISSSIANIDLFKRETDSNGNWDWDTGIFVGRPFKVSYTSSSILMADAWKERANGVPQGCFLLAYYDCDPEKPEIQEALLLRVIEPAELPTDKDMVSSMVEYYKDHIRTGNTQQSQLDEYSRYEFGFSGLRCSILGSFYLDSERKLRFGADVENFYAAHNYSVIKPSNEILGLIANYRENGVPGGNGDIRIGSVRYSSSQRFNQAIGDIPVYIQAKDFAGKRTALFGMTRTGKSNSIKKIIQANEQMSGLARHQLDSQNEDPKDILEQFIGEAPKYPIGQIIFDINGEYANANLQDEGTAIFDIYKDKTERYSIVEKEGFKVMKVNFYNEIEAGFELIKSYPLISDDKNRFMMAFKSVDLSKPEESHPDYHSSRNRYNKRVSVYKCILFSAGFNVPQGETIKLHVNKELLKIIRVAKPRQESAKDSEAKFYSESEMQGEIDLRLARDWWLKFCEIYREYKNPPRKSKFDNKNNSENREEMPSELLKDFLDKYKEDKGHDYIDEDLKTLLSILFKKNLDDNIGHNGYKVLTPIKPQHTEKSKTSFENDILQYLRQGKIVIADLSSGDEELQRMYSERITRHIFRDSMERFTQAKPNNFIQFYFEEAHNLFPKKDDKDLSQIYNRLAKEGAKLNLGLVYATQEVSSISSNILKATQNWFISHLNNEDEIRELRKYYDFSDFSDSLIRFSQNTDKGFVRVKTYSNSFVVPVQVDKFGR